MNGNVIALWNGSAWASLVVPEFAGALGTKTSALCYDVFDFTSSLTPSATNTSTDIVTFGSSHALVTGAYATPASTVGGLTLGTDYWVNVASGTTLSFHTTLANALAGTSKVDLTANVTQAITFVSQEQLAWTNATTRATAVTIQDGRYCKSGDKTRLHVGTFYTTGTTTTEDSQGGTTTQLGGKRFLWNRYNRVQRTLAVKDTTSSWVYQTGTWRVTNGNNGNVVQFVLGDTERPVTARYFGTIAMNHFVSNRAAIGIGLDSATPAGFSQGGYTATAAGIYIIAACSSVYSGTPAVGYHYLAGLEFGATGSTDCQFSGLDADSGQCGMSAEVWM